MLHQYSPQRQRRAVIRNRSVAVGTIPIGTIFTHPLNGRRHIVTAWLPREIGAARRTAAGQYENTFVARGGHLATVRKLADGRTQTLADHHILRALADD